MHSAFTVRRSAEWLAKRRLALATNVPEDIEVTIDLSELSTEVRGLLLSYRGGEYSPRYHRLDYNSDYRPAPWSFYGSAYFRADSDSPTAAEVNDAILAAFAQIDAKRLAAEQERAAQETRDRALAAEWAALPLEQRARNNGSEPRYCRDILKKYCPDAWAEAVDRSTVNLKIARGEKAAQDRATLADFLAAIPEDAKRGALKRLAHTDEAVESLRQRIEDASPVVIFGDDEDDE